MQRLRLRFRAGVRSARVNRRPKRREPMWVVRARRGGRLALLARTFEFLVDSRTRWQLGKRAIRKRMQRIRPRDTRRTTLERILEPFRRRFRYERLDVVPDSAEKDFDIIGRMNPTGKVAEVDDLTGLHTGDLGDPIPIHWYKPPESYPRTIALQLTHPSPETVRIPMMSRRTVTDPEGNDHVIGTNFVVDKNTVLIRTKSPKRGRAVPRFRSLLSSMGYDWTGEDADHVRDLGMGGDDDQSNLWPLDTDINQRATTRGRWYSTYRIEYADDKDGTTERKEKPLMRLKGKRFKIIGFTYPPPSPGGRDKT